MQLKGWTRTSLIDFPDHISTVLFTGGCNFRCPPCHNADLVLRPGELPNLPLEEVRAFLTRRAGLVDGVVITGGEPTLQNGLIPSLCRARERGLDVKLDTNGYRPDVLAVLLDERLVDYVAMDVKAPPGKYSLLAGRTDLDVNRLERSITLLQDSGIPYELRTTVVPGLLDEDDVEEIARWVAGAGRYVLQQFRPLHTLDPALEAVTPYPVERLQAMAWRADRWVTQVAVR
ncbi:MAG: anaerobic ribonucleoside-triphosphate reductase activating protein [Chloroflexota bacterium]|nr:anaerobic ribonucleoside-triphosphate reductase activating protein [Chloroflexota bacterium]